MSFTTNSENVLEKCCKNYGCNCVPIASKGLPISIKIAVEKYMNLFGNENDGRVVLPIDTIDGIKVKTEFIVNHNGMSIMIYADSIKIYAKTTETTGADGKINYWKTSINIAILQILFRKTYIKKLTKYTLKDYESVLRCIHKDIGVMKLDKLNGVLVTPSIKHPKEMPHVMGCLELRNVPCDDAHPEECSVCLDTTKTTTPCGHKLCVDCWSKLKRNEDELPCPICRDDLFQMKKIYGDDVMPIDHNGSDDDSDDDSDDNFEAYDDNYIEYDEFPSVRENSIMDMN